MLSVRSRVPQDKVAASLDFSSLFYMLIISLHSSPFLLFFSMHMTQSLSIQSICRGTAPIYKRILTHCIHGAKIGNSPSISPKCYILYTSRSCSFSPFFYTIGGKIIQTFLQQRDLGVLINSNFSWSVHIATVCGKTISITSLINVEKQQLLISQVTSPLTYCFSGHPHLIKDINKALGRVQC